MKYVAVLELTTDGGWNALSRTYPAASRLLESKEETERLIREAIPLHIESLREEGEYCSGTWVVYASNRSLKKN